MVGGVGADQIELSLKAKKRCLSIILSVVAIKLLSLCNCVLIIACSSLAI